VLKLDAGGHYVTAWQVGGKYDDYGLSLEVDGSFLYFQGNFQGTADFDPSSSVVSRTSVGGVDTFIAKYTTSGALVRVQTIGSTSDESDWRLVSDTNYLYLTGEIHGTVDLDPGPGTVNLTDAGGGDVVVAKYAKADGTLVWARRFGGPGQD